MTSTVLTEHLLSQSAFLSTVEMPRIVASGVTWGQFLALSDGRHIEWIDGEVLEKPMPSSEHQRILRFVFRLFEEWLERHEVGEFFFDPFVMRLESRGRAPDMAFVSAENASRVEDNFLNGPADLVVEVISPSTAHVDRGGKFQEYQRGGVREYWIIDPDQRTAAFYQLVDGIYQNIEVRDGVYASAVIQGMTLRIEWFWLRPPSTDLLREWKLI